MSVTAPSAEEAGALGRMAVASRLAACAQVSGPITSTYRWEGEVTQASEWLCTMKTTSDRLDALMVATRAAHSYEVPEIVATAITAGDAAYLAWIEESTRP
ncbi:MAG TPA: divalent-cation tolerance protein CutA [Acidimicrobiales bacterium]